MSDERQPGAAGAVNNLRADLFYAVTMRALIGAGLPRGYKVQLVIDGDGALPGRACFGSVNPARLRTIVNESVDGHQRRESDAVSVLSRFTLRGIRPEFRIGGSNA